MINRTGLSYVLLSCYSPFLFWNVTNFAYLSSHPSCDFSRLLSLSLSLHSSLDFAFQQNPIALSFSILSSLRGTSSPSPFFLNWKRWLYTLKQRWQIWDHIFRKSIPKEKYTRLTNSPMPYFLWIVLAPNSYCEHSCIRTFRQSVCSIFAHLSLASSSFQSLPEHQLLLHETRSPYLQVFRSALPWASSSGRFGIDCSA